MQFHSPIGPGSRLLYFPQTVVSRKKRDGFTTADSRVLVNCLVRDTRGLQTASQFNSVVPTVAVFETTVPSRRVKEAVIVA
jgi:hypothetical protein